MRLKILLFTICLFFISPTVLFAQNSYSTQFHIYTTNTTLTLDPQYSKPYDIVVAPFTETSGNSYGEIFSFKNEKLGDFQFTTDQEGPLTISAPFFNNGARAVLYGSTTAIKPLEISIRETATCNENSICEERGGESNKTCPSDCRPIVLETKTQATSNSKLIWFIIIGFFATAGIGTGIFLYLRRKNNATN